MASRWIEQPGNKALKGDALIRALDAEDWDASVKSLIPFPTVLKTMSDQLDWTQKLGDVFLAQQGEMFAAVQALRGRAQAAGTLQSNSQQTVTQGRPGDRDCAGAAASGLHARLQSHRGLRRVAISVLSAGILPASAGRLSWHGIGDRAGVRRRDCDHRGAVGLGQPELGRRQCECQREPLQQHQFKPVNGYRNASSINSSTWQHNANHRRGVAYSNPGVRQQYRPNAAGNAASRDASGRTAAGGAGTALAGQRAGGGNLSNAQRGGGNLSNAQRAGGGNLSNAQRPNTGARAQATPRNVQRPAGSGASPGQRRLPPAQTAAR